LDNLQLIDWRMVAFASLWVFGLSIVVATLGFANHEATRRRERLLARLRRPGSQAALDVGATFFCLGMLGSSGAVWEMALWGLLGGAFAVDAVAALRRRRRSGAA
jgi:hypothetical protein